MATAEDKARQAAEALGNGDMEAFLGAHAENVAVHIPGSGPASGDHNGRDAFGQAFAQLAQSLDGPPGWETHDVVSGGEHTVVLGTQSFTKGGQTFETNVAAVIHSDDNGQFSEVWVHPFDAEGLDKFVNG